MTMLEANNEDQAWPRYPPADITPAEFEIWTAQVFEVAARGLEKFTVTIHDRVAGVDGEFDFDATVRFEWAGMSFLVVVEAKRHNKPVKRELVQVLQSKVQSVGGHKGVMFSTAGFQRGAVEFAKVHGIALVSITEGRFLIETRSIEPAPALSREAATRLWDLPVFAGRCFSPGDNPDSTRVTTIDVRNPEYVRTLLLGLPE